MRFSAVFAVLGSLVLGVSAANAATDFTATYDPTQATITSTYFQAGGFSLDSSHSAGVGTTFSLSYSFGGAGVSGTFTGATVAALTAENSIQDLFISGTLKFLNVVGNAISPTPLSVGYDTTDPWTSIGSISIGTNLINTPNFVSFSPLATTIYGILFEGTIEGALGDGGLREYSTGYIQLFGSDISTVAAVPVPAALPLLGAGLGALGFMGWRKKRSSAASAA